MQSNSTVDPRLLNLSYSGLLMAHTCPRKFQLAKQASISGEDSQSSKITFAYGHVVGLGIQNVLEGKTPEQNLWEMFMSWDVDLWSDNPKQKKSFLYLFHLHLILHFFLPFHLHSFHLCLHLRLA